MIIDCGRCPRRAESCQGCLVSTLLDTPAGIGDLTAEELRAIELFELGGFEVRLLETPAPVAPARLGPVRRDVA